MDRKLLMKLSVFTLVILFVCSSLLGCTSNGLVLPGQKKAASDLLINTMNEVREQTGRDITIDDISKHPIEAVRSARGHCEVTDNTVLIWVESGLSYNDQEAVLAHELAHAIQAAEGYCQTGSKRDENGLPVLPEITWLGSRINSLVHDVMADNWAAGRGFQVEEGLRRALAEALEEVDNKKLSNVEYTDWDSYYLVLVEVSRKIESGGSIEGQVSLPPEVETQIRAVNYANYSLRLSKLEKFSELDDLWSEHWPESRKLGKEIAKLVSETGTNSSDDCERVIIRVLEYLHIPPALLIVGNPCTGEIVWPK